MDDAGRKSAKTDKQLGELAKRTNVAETELTKCGLERRQPNLRDGRPLLKVPEWILDNDFAGQTSLPPTEDMERMDREMRAAIAEIERQPGPAPAPQTDRLFENFASWWAESIRRPIPVPSGKAPSKYAGGQKKDGG